MAKEGLFYWFEHAANSDALTPLPQAGEGSVKRLRRM